MAAAELGAGAKQWIPLQRQLVPTSKDAAEAYRRNVRRRQKEAIQSALSKGYLKTLDRDMILQQWSAEGGRRETSSAEDLECVLRVSLPSSRVQAIDDIALLMCVRLRICNLPDCLVNDMAGFYDCVNLLKLDLSNNQIEQVPRGDFWSSLSSLRVLHLHGNGITRRSCLQSLNHCPRLHVLTLHSTPLSLSRNYRHHVVNGIVSLQALDEFVVSDEEIIENLSLQGSFQAFSPHLRLQLYPPYGKDASFVSELRGVYHLLLTVDRLLAHCSPVLVVQRWVRGWLARRALARSPDTRIRSLLSQHRFTGKSEAAAPPPPNTAATTQRPAPQATVQQAPSQAPLEGKSPSRRTISAQVPLPSHVPSMPMTIPKSFSDTTATLNASLPAPPPTSPTFHLPRARERALNRAHLPRSPLSLKRETTTLPLESYTLAVDPDSSRLRQSLTINLNQLQQSLPDYGGRTNVMGAQKLKRKSPEKSPRHSTQRAVKRRRHSIGRESEHLQEKEELQSEDVEGVAVSGQRAELMLEDNRVEKMALEKREDRQRVRQAEKQIMETLAKTREPPPKGSLRVDPPTTIHGAPRLSKDALAFRRVFESMALSTLKAVDRIHQASKADDNWSRKAAHVSRMKDERERRRRKIEDIRRSTKETIEAWRIMEENKLERLSEENVRRASVNLLNKSIQRNAADEKRKRKAEDRIFAADFMQQTTGIGREIAKDDHEITAEEKREDTRDQVQQIVEATRQKRDETQTEKEIRDTQLVWEGVLAKKNLDGKMVEAAAQRMVEAKRRVGRAVQQRKAARATVARARETLRTNASQDKTHGSLAPPRLDLRSESQLAEACSEALEVATAESKSASSPFRLRRFTREANRSWQRGAIVLAERERQGITQFSSERAPAPYFPLIDRGTVETPPLMYPMMRPGCIMRSLASTPFQSEITELSPTTTATTAAASPAPEPPRTHINETSTKSHSHHLGVA